MFLLLFEEEGTNEVGEVVVSIAFLFF